MVTPDINIHRIETRLSGKIHSVIRWIDESLILKSIVISCVCGLIVASTWTAVYFYTTSHRLRERQREEIESILAFCQKSYPVPLFNFDISTIQHLNDAVLMNRNMRIIRVFERDMLFALGSTDGNPAGKAIDSYSLIRGRIEYNGENIGTIELVYDRSEIDRDILHSLAWTGISTFSIVIVLLIILYYFTRLVMVKPVVDLSGIMRQVADSNDYSMKIESPSGDEIGILYRGFNFLLENIRNRESELKKTGAYLQNIIESMPSILITLDDEFRVGQWNHAAEDETGIPSKDIIGQILMNVTPFMNGYIPDISRVMESRKPVHYYHREMAIPGRTGDTGYRNISLYPLLAEELRGVVIRIDDITDMERMENQLRQIQKMEILGTIAGGLAHDFNNMLGGIIGTLSLLRFRIDQGKISGAGDLSSHINIMEESALRARDMASQLLSLSRQQDLRFQPVDLNISMKHIYQICSNTFDKCIDIEFSYYPSPAIVSGDMTQIEQVLLNLCVNAMHSMTIMRPFTGSRGGKLRVSLDRRCLDESSGCGMDAVEGDYWVLGVEDTGVGMDRETIGRIFEPFFTTKSGQGTGPGLSVVYNIIRQHGGFLDVQSEKGRGSVFTVFLPAPGVDMAPADSVDKTHIERGSGCILVIDDEVTIRDLTVQLLGECGYDVLTAENGVEALEIYRRKHDEISVVILDMVMPLMGGRETLGELRKINPSLKILLMSGYRSGRGLDNLDELHADGFIEKPFTLLELSRKLNDIRESSPETREL